MNLFVLIILFLLVVCFLHSKCIDASGKTKFKIELSILGIFKTAVNVEHDEGIKKQTEKDCSAKHPSLKK